MITPAEIVSALDRRVIGQARAKRTLAIAVHQHHLATAYTGSTRIKKANVLLLGPTGVGKTYLCQTVAELLDVPFAAITATSISPEGWRGNKAETVVEWMYQKSKQRYGKDGAWKKAQTGICYIDEIDKIANRKQETQPGGNAASDQTFNTSQVQQGLLRVVEGAQITLDGNPTFPTDQVLFIASGAFVGLDQMVKKRSSLNKNAVGPVNILRDVIPADLIAYGLLPEFVGRFPVTAALDALTERDLVSIMRDVDDCIVAQKSALLSVRGATLEVPEVVLREIARKALAQGTGARGVQSEIEKRLEKALIDLPDGATVRLTSDGAQWDPVSSLKGAEAPPPCDGEPTPPSPEEMVTA